MRVYLSDSDDAAVNLAIEESLLETIEPDDELLLLYENCATVVIGRFQNPWRECRTGLIGRSGIMVLRRLSGGGTVVHSSGNLNFSIVSGRRVPDKEGNLDRVIAALGELGIKLERNNHSDLILRVGDRGECKVSGSAFRQTRAASLHHGTLLVDADLHTLRRLLAQSPRDISGRFVASRPSPVGNLSDVCKGIRTDLVIQTLAAAWGDCGGPMRLDVREFGDGDFREAVKKFRSTWWTWEKTPDFSERFTGLDGYGPGSLELMVSGGHIAAAGKGAEFLMGVPYHGGDILACMPLEDRPSWLADLARRVDGDS